MEIIDGYEDNLNFYLALIDKESNEFLKGGFVLHDKCINYISEVDSKT